MFDLSIDRPLVFRHVLRRLAYLRHRDPENVHEEAMKFANANLDIFDRRAHEFDIEEMKAKIKGRLFVPSGYAAGMDKNGDMLEPNSRIFGYLKPGTALAMQRDGNTWRPRISVDDANENMDNAQSFPFNGLDYLARKIISFRYNEGLRKDSRIPIFVSISGIPMSPDDIEDAYKQIETIVVTLLPYVDGFELNDWSPNTEVLVYWRKPRHYERRARLIRDIAGPDYLLQAKIGAPTTDEEEKESLELGDALMKGGGDGFTLINTLKVLRPDWPSGSAGRSGRILREYRNRTIARFRKEFPKAIITATGGVFDPEDAYILFRDYKVNMVEKFTPLTFYGYGLEKHLLYGVFELMKQDGYQNMRELQRRAGTTSSRTSSGRL